LAPGYNVQSTVPNRTTRHADDETSSINACPTFSIPKLGRLIHDLIERWKHVVGELDLSYRLHPFYCRSNCEPRNALLCQGGVEHSIRPKFGLEIHCASEDTTKPNIFAKHDSSIGFG
jgi:hypothetical protein